MTTCMYMSYWQCAVVVEPCLCRGRMDTDDLDKVIREEEAKGHVPFVVVGTAGTTVLAAFDPLDKIADICRAHNAWFHVDVRKFVEHENSAISKFTIGKLWRLLSCIQNLQSSLQGNCEVRHLGTQL